MDSVSFFDYADSVKKKKMPADQIGTMFPICNVVSASVLLVFLTFAVWCSVCNIWQPSVLPKTHDHIDSLAAMSLKPGSQDS